jgi:hypothetical protein
MRNYKPSNIAPSQGVAILAASSLVSGVAIGGATAFLGKFIYFIVLFPLGMGFATGSILGFAVKKGKIRSPIKALGLGLLGGIVTYGALMYGQYMNFQQEIITEYKITDKTLANEEINAFLQQETGSSGFVGFVKISAKEGITISGRGSSKITIKDNFVYLLWLLELGVVGFLAASIPFKSASEPFNEEGNEWYGAIKLVGSATEESRDELIRLLNMDDIAGASALLSSQTDMPTPRVDVYSQSCATATFSDSVITVNYVSTNAKKQLEVKEILTGLVSESQRSQLVPQISAPTPETPEA